MVAGASGIDLALLVVAADEGIMPQTVEHLAVLEHLGIAAGIPVMTKADLVEPDWLELMLLEVAEWLAGSRVSFDAPLATSAVPASAWRSSGRGWPPGRSCWRAAWGGSLPAPGRPGVLTGGRRHGRDRDRLVRPGPSGRRGHPPAFGPARPRALDRELRSDPRAERAGPRTALGLAGLAREDAHRGTWIVAADSVWPPSATLDVEITL